MKQDQTQTPRTLAALRKRAAGGRAIVALTAYDAGMASWLSGCDVDFILVGDSLGNVVAGHATTLPVTMDDMVYHTRMVVRGAGLVPVIADMPFLSYEISPEEALRNAGRLIKEGGASAVKMEGGIEITDTVRRMVAARIPVLGHTGLKPQAVLQLGGYRVQGKTRISANAVRREARALQDAGVFALVLECVPAALAQSLTKALAVPTIGIGAGPACDGQILVTHDLLGWSETPKKFVKPYAGFLAAARKAVGAFAGDVRAGRFPDKEHSF